MHTLTLEVHLYKKKHISLALKTVFLLSNFPVVSRVAFMAKQKAETCRVAGQK